MTTQINQLTELTSTSDGDLLLIRENATGVDKKMQASNLRAKATTKDDVGLGDVDNVSAANLRDRSTHTGTQPLSTISDAGNMGLQNKESVNIDGGTIDGTAVNATNLAYTGTLTGGTGVVNLGSGQVVKDANGNVGIGTTSPSRKLHVVGDLEQEGNFFTNGEFRPNGARVHFARHSESLPSGDIDRSFERDFDADFFNLFTAADGDINLVKYTAWTRDVAGTRFSIYRGSFNCRRSSSGSLDIVNFAELESPTIAQTASSTMAGLSLTVSLVNNRIRFAFSNTTANFSQIKLTISRGAP